MSTSGFVETLRRPEYTGENRCIPCTVTNLAIALVASAVVSLLWLPLGVVVFAASLASIYLRGYLVPGTPDLTRRYFPDWLLSAFDKDPRMDAAGVDVAGDGADAETLDAEAVLRTAGAIVDDERGEDVVLAPDFERAWFDRMDRVDHSRTDVDELADLLSVEADRLSLDRHDDAVVAYLDGRWIGQWESRAAFVADLAGDRELESRVPSWNDLPLAHRSEVLGGLRLCLDRCPACGGSVVVHQDVVESCCRSKDVVAATCEQCDARLFEADYDAELFEQPAA
ncbi:MAG: hypothetical protein ABEJ22_09895 [Haloferacaceae archaeon]